MSLARLYLDFETKSELDLKVSGLGNYVKHPSTAVLMLAYAFEEEPVQVWEPDIHGMMPKPLRGMLDDITISKVAWDARFEENVFRYVLKYPVPIGFFEDPSVKARMLSMPGALKDVCTILELPAEFRKDTRRAEFVKLFCTPAKTGGDVTLFGVEPTWFRNRDTHPRDWAEFRDYCIQDVVSMREACRPLDKFTLPESEYEGWILDYTINERGLPVDLDLAKGARNVATAEKERLRAKLKTLTGLENPGSNQQILGWVQKHGYPFGSIGKPFVKRALADPHLDDEGRQALLLRGQLAKTSDSKYEAVMTHVSEDGRLRHQYVFMGAAKTGRWASFDVQLANLPRPTKEVEKNLDLAIQLLKDEDRLGLELEFPNVLEVVASCVRSMFRARPGYRFLIADLAAIETRVGAWLSGCTALMNVFIQKKCPYLEFGARMHGLSYDDLKARYDAGDPKAKEIRQNAKPAVLGCLFRLSGGEQIENSDGDLVKTGLWGYAASMGIELSQEQSHEAVKVWRKAYSDVCNYWFALEDAVKTTMYTGLPQTHDKSGKPLHVTIQKLNEKILGVRLPSGRSLHYVNPSLHTEDFKGRERTQLWYSAIDPKTKQWMQTKTHGGKLTENLCQSVARDILLHGMVLASRRGLQLVGHTHDELLAEQSFASESGLDTLIECMTVSPEWAEDLPLEASGFESEVYRKG